MDICTMHDTANLIYLAVTFSSGAVKSTAIKRFKSNVRKISIMCRKSLEKYPKVSPNIFRLTINIQGLRNAMYPP